MIFPFGEYRPGLSDHWAHVDRQSKGRDRKDLPLETRIQFSHLHADALEFRACGARREVRVTCGQVSEGALPGDIRLAETRTAEALRRTSRTSAAKPGLA
jgi:hypothetical protein